MSEQNTTNSMRIVAGIGGLKITDNGLTTSRGDPKEFVIVFKSIGLQTCLVVSVIMFQFNSNFILLSLY